MIHNLIAGETQAGPFSICPETDEQTRIYALCASAQCWTIDSVAYCKCDLRNGRNISTPYYYRESGQKKDVCDLLTQGIDNGFSVSTYAPPRQILKSYQADVEKLGPPMAIYTCDPKTDTNSLGAYSAQCDGGLCFLSTQGQAFPGLGKLDDNQLICSCPPKQNSTPFQIIGPWSCSPGEKNLMNRCCDRGFFKRYCGIHSITRTGTIIPVGAPVGIGRLLTKKLEGTALETNECFSSN